MKEVFNGEYWLNKGIVFINGQIDGASAFESVQRLIFLFNEGFSTITVMINSPGGSVTDGFYIHDTMQMLKSQGVTVRTVCCGMCASMGAFLLAAGSKGSRCCLANSEVMIHSVLAGMQGQASDLKIQFENIFRAKAKYEKLLAEYCDKEPEEIEAATDRDNYMEPYQAIQFGLVDKVIEKISDIMEE